VERVLFEAYQTFQWKYLQKVSLIWLKLIPPVSFSFLMWLWESITSHWWCIFFLLNGAILDWQIELLSCFYAGKVRKKSINTAKKVESENSSLHFWRGPLEPMKATDFPSPSSSPPPSPLLRSSQCSHNRPQVQPALWTPALPAGAPSHAGQCLPGNSAFLSISVMWFSQTALKNIWFVIVIFYWGEIHIMWN
jgi:hypothetical protein